MGMSLLRLNAMIGAVVEEADDVDRQLVVAGDVIGQPVALGAGAEDGHALVEQAALLQHPHPDRAGGAGQIEAHRAAGQPQQGPGPRIVGGHLEQERQRHHEQAGRQPGGQDPSAGAAEGEPDIGVIDADHLGQHGIEDTAKQCRAQIVVGRRAEAIGQQLRQAVAEADDHAGFHQSQHGGDDVQQDMQPGAWRVRRIGRAGAERRRGRRGGLGL